MMIAEWPKNHSAKSLGVGDEKDAKINFRN